MTLQLSRKERRADRVKASKFYGLGGDGAMTIRAAYRAIAEKQSARAVQLAYQVSQNHPDNIHPWLVLGAVALERREANTAGSFFKKALEIKPRNVIALVGKGKSHLLSAEVIQAVAYFQAAISAGSNDLTMARLYADLMARMARFSDAAAHLQIICTRNSDADLWYRCGEFHVGAEEFIPAALAFDNAFDLDPKPSSHRVAKAKALIFRHQYAEADDWLDRIIPEDPDSDELPTLKMMVLRNLGRSDAALPYVDFAYQKPVYYQRALTQSAYVFMDQGDYQAAEDRLLEATFVDNEGQAAAKKSLASLLFLRGKFDRGADLYGARNLTADGKHLSSAPIIRASLADQPTLYIRAEQGIGDQFAMLPLSQLAGRQSTDFTTTFVGEMRMKPIVENSSLSLGFCSEDHFKTFAKDLDSGQMCFLGDLVRLAGSPPAAGRNFGGYITVPPEETARLKQRYRLLADGRPTFGVAWRSRESLTGHHRSIALDRLVEALPKDAFVINLQYGDCKAEIKAAKRTRPDVTIINDSQIDQMTDLMGFLTQIIALDHIVTIDNTTAHACGALGHENTHVLLPTGAECMWYWGLNGNLDPWYSTLNLHRQTAAQNWDQPLVNLRQSLR